MKYFIFAIVFLLSVATLQAQDFFVPSGAFSSTVEKLKPINDDQSQLSPYSQRRYKVIDGRVFAIKDEMTEAPQETEPTDNPIVTSPQLPSPAEPAALTTVAEKIPTPVVETPVLQVPQISAPQTAPVDSKLPSYKNRYALYLNDLQTFQKTKQMPENKDLAATLKKLSEPREIVLFQGKLE
ncbi:MAG TPA: hypothetical protein DIC64_01055 [Alphaproteobacteria bacterium]|nr:hypothetical protein [Alphaproteobacteria bacterium]